MNRALIVVDVQNDFCPGGALPVPKGDEVVAPINRMIEYVRPTNNYGKNDWIIAVSADCHPQETNHFKTYEGAWPVHCVAGTPGAELHPNLLFVANPIQVYLVLKGTKKDENAYSVFDGFLPLKKNLSLDDFLQEQNIGEVYICGLATDYCVKATALDAVKLGFRTYLLRDACRAVNINPGDEEAAIEEMRIAGVVITTTDEVMKL